MSATVAELHSLLADASYALRQCRRFRDPERAADAIERIEATLDRLIVEAEAVDLEYEPTAEELADLYAHADACEWDDLPF